MSFKNRFSQIFFATVLALFILMLIRVFFFFKYQSFFQDLSLSEVFLSLLYGFRVDIITIFTFLGIFILILSLPFKFVFNKRFKKYLAVLWSVIFSFILMICIADILYFEFSNRHVSNEILAIFDDINILLSMAFNSMLFYTLGSFIFFAIIFYINIKIFTADLQSKSINQKSYIALFIVILILFAGIRNTIYGKSFGISDAYVVQKNSSGTLAINGFFSFYRTIFVYKGTKKVKLMPFNEASLLAKEYLKSEKFSFTNDNLPIQRALNEQKKIRNFEDKPNILIILLESWGAEHIDGFTKYKELNVTPYFKELSQKSLKFTNFYANGYRSIYGITSIYTGITLPSGFQYLGSGLELTRLSYLGRIAKNNSYSTIAMQSSNKRSYRVDAVSSLAGFDDFYGAEDMPNIELVDSGRKPQTGTYDFNMFDFMHKKLNSQKEPFLGFMFTSTNHSDFYLPSAKFERYLHTLSGYNGFLNSLIYVDNAIERFMKSIEKEPWFDNTIFIFTADHGHSDALNEIGKELRKGDKAEPSIEHYRIPLLIYSPKYFEAQEIKTLGSQNDIMPTIIDILGFKDSFSAMGNSLFDETVKNRFVYSFGGDKISFIDKQCFITYNYKNIVDSNCEDTKQEFMQKSLKAIDSFEVELLDKNIWAN